MANSFAQYGIHCEKHFNSFIETIQAITDDMQRRAAEIVETFLTDIFGEELRPWEESARAVREPSA